MKVYIRDEVKEIQSETSIRVKDLVERKLQLNPEEILVIDRKKGKILSPDSEIMPDDEVEIRMVISGG